MNVVGFTRATDEVGDGQLVDNILHNAKHALQHIGGSSSSSNNRHLQTPQATHPMHSARVLEEFAHVAAALGVVPA